MPGAVATVLAVMYAALMCQCGAGQGYPAPERLTHTPFDTVRVYRPQGEARRLAILISGDGGWGAGIGAIARDLTGADTLVAGIDGAEFLRSLGRSAASCVSPGEQLAQLGRFLIARYRLPSQVRPTLVGHSAGASLAYVALAQAPAGTFNGALTLSFCTELDLTRPLCPAAALRSAVVRSGLQLQPGGALPAAWIAVHGLDDQVCPASAGRAFADRVPAASFIAISGVDHNYRDRSRWWPAFLGGYQRLSGQAAGAAAPAP
jgi:type IV secretory pathway VirJ component